MNGFWPYLRFIARRERVVSAIWAAAVVLFTFAIAAYYPSLFPDEASIASMAEMLRSPAMVGMMGPVYGGAMPSVAMLFSQEMSVWVYIAVAVMNIFLVLRHTRGDEELGRLEMFRSLPVGRLTGASSVMAFALALNLVIALLTAAFVSAAGMAGGDLIGAAAYSFAVFGVGVFFAAVTLLFAQLFSAARGVSGAAFAVLGASYMLRAMGDARENALSYISPLGLGLRVFAFHDNNFRYVAVLLIEALAAAAVALAVLALRDHGQGIIPARKGRAAASRFLRGPFGLAWRLTRNTALVWCLVMLVFGAMYGSMFGDLESFIASNEYYRQIISGGADLQGSMIDSFAAFLFIILSLVSAIPVINIANKIHAEEKRGRLEPLLAGSVGRGRLYAAYIAIGVLECAAIQICAAIGVFAPSNGLVGLGDMLAAGLAYVPALLFMLGLAVFLTGILPKLTALVWVVYGYAFFAALFGRMFTLPEILSRLTPFGNVPQMPAASFDAAPLVILTALAALLTAVGLWGFRRRDVG